MRIIAGEFKGRSIKAVPGDSTRPTTDRIREAWASALASALPEGFEGIRVLDAFAGSGALGLEALSRGAARVSFCESNRRALETLKANIASLGVGTDSATVLSVDTFAAKALPLLTRSGPYDLVILDPPYDYAIERIRTLLKTLAASDSLSEGALVSYEHREGENIGLEGTVLAEGCSPATLKLLSCKSYGRIQLEYLVYER
jgi:16S rRNA (guanine966-N2)-methyltransferase